MKPATGDGLPTQERQVDAGEDHRGSLECGRAEACSAKSQLSHKQAGRGKLWATALQAQALCNTEILALPWDPKGRSLTSRLTGS